jgi:hypothetical protein
MIDFLNNPVPITSSIGAIEPLLKLIYIGNYN